ncbi:hypothetical protein GCM10009817_05800 [Terrabacter lapilli]|uniref:Lipoprotein n=1 Tax=Terrabacter lapilli TaxID=436231 RepID=A0ABP5CUL9_9MICO
MGETVVRAAAAAAAVVVLAACGGTTVSCGACPGPLWLTVRRAPSTVPGPPASGVGSGPTAGMSASSSASSGAAPASVRVCVAGLPCEEKEWDEGDTVYLHPPRDVRPSDLDGRVVRVTVRGSGVELTGVGALVFHDGADGPCSCSYSTAEVQVGG